MRPAKSVRTAANALTINRRPPIRKRWGQHFLSDPNTIGRIVAEVHPVPSDYFLEIGPGHGELTIPLAESGAEVIAVDIDPLLINDLRGQVPSNVTLEQGDILKADLSLLLRDGARIYGSLPYNISSQIIFKLLEHRQRWTDGHFIVQKEVGQRMAAGPGSKTFGRMSVMLQAFAGVQTVFNLPPTVFKPMPKVDSTLVRIVPGAPVAHIADPRRFEVLVRAAFSQRRKKLSNALKSLDAADSIMELGLEDLRAEHISVEAFIELSNKANIKVP